MKIKYEQKFHSVGQGLFYSSSLYLNNHTTANIIFDCGSENIKLVNEKIDKLENYKIDILIISHLHFDHISGLNYLLDNKKAEIKTIILPYLFTEERILIQFLNYNKPKWYNDFLSNPYSYLNEKENVGRVIIINGSDDDEKDYSVNFPKEIQPLNENKINDSGIQIKLEDVDEKTKKSVEKNENLQFGKKLLLMKDIGYILISNMYLSFFNYKIEKNEKVNDFYKKIKELKITDTKSALNILRVPETRKELIRSYKIISRNLNITSLAASQGFIMPFNTFNNRKHSISIYGCNSSQYNFLNDFLCCDYCDYDCFIDCHFHGRSIIKYKYKFYIDCFSDYHKNCNSLKVIGTLLLGDIKLDYKTKKRKEMFTHFKNLLPFVKLVQLSHHGAKNGWNEDLIKKIPRNSLYIACHKMINKYNHPHKKVIMELAENNRKFISVTENNEYFDEIEFKIN